jgi:hypothetical protein
MGIFFAQLIIAKTVTQGYIKIYCNGIFNNYNCVQNRLIRSY